MRMSPPLPLPTMAAAHLPRLPVFVFPLLVFLGVHVPASHGSSAQLPSIYDSSICSETFMCGRVNISYPFYLSNATRGTTDYTSNYSCGYTDLEIYCRGEGLTATPVIRLGGDNYTVLNISYDNRTIILADSDVLGDGVIICPAVRHDVSFDNRWLHNTGSNVNLTFFFSCYPKSGFSNYQIDCKEFKSPFGDGPSFVFTTDDQAQEQGLLCKETVSVPVNSGLLNVMASNRTMFTSGGYGVVLKHGFELVWSYTTADQCYQQCEQSGGRCAYSQNREFLGCLCSDGKVSKGCKKVKSFRIDASIYPRFLFPIAIAHSAFHSCVSQ